MSAPTALAAGQAARTGVRPGTAARVGGAALGLVAAARFLGTDGGPELCVFRRCAGIECPGCGGARAAHHLLHGEVSAAWADHPWVVLAAAQAVVALVIVAVTVRASPPGRVRPRWRRAGMIVGIVNVVALAAIWLLRLSSGSLPGGG